MTFVPLRMTALAALAVLGTVGRVDAADTSNPLAAKKAHLELQNPLGSAGSDFQETAAGDLVADAVLEDTQSDIALVPGDEFADITIPAGPISPDKLRDCLRYSGDAGDDVVTVTLQGAQVLAALERGVSRAPQPFEGFLQIAGLQVRYVPSAAGGKRVEMAGIGGGDIAAQRTYHVAMPQRLANGSFGYFKVWPKDLAARNTGKSIAQCLADYAAGHRVLSGSVDHRLATR